MTNAAFSTADLYDSAPERYRMCDLPFRHFGGLRRFAGPCATVIASDNPSTIGNVLAEPGKGRVLLLDGGAAPAAACLGDVLGARAVENGWVGVIVAGAVRDSAALAKLPLGVLALRTTAVRDFGSGRGGARDVVLMIGGVKVHPGDLIYADEDAVLILSAQHGASAGDSVRPTAQVLQQDDPDARPGRNDAGKGVRHA